MSLTILLLGNHTVGVRALGTLAKMADVVGVVAHPQDPEDGIRYESVYEHAQDLGIEAIRARPGDGYLQRFAKEHAPDLLWTTDYRYIIPGEMLEIPPLGGVNLHPSLLPAYKGRAPVNWAILEGEETLGLTAHFLEENVDGGDIIEQRSFRLGQHEDVGDALDYLFPIYEEVTARVIEHFLAGDVPRTKQDPGAGKTYPARTPEDGHIDWSQSNEQVHNLVRGVAQPYPGAFTYLGHRKLTIWAATKTDREGKAPGEILSPPNDNRRLEIACGRGALVAEDWDLEEDPSELAEGVILT